MSQNKGFVDVINISSDDDDDGGKEEECRYYSAEGGNEEQREEDGVGEAGRERRGEVKRAGADASPSSVVVKTEKEKREDDDDCCILDYDPFDSAADLVSKLSLADNDDDDGDHGEEVSVLAETGEVACRDFPHSRHLCAEFIFDKTPHESYCPQCYCFVCDTPAPCTRWKGSRHSHCHASDQQQMWKDMRNASMKTKPKPDS